MMVIKWEMAKLQECRDYLARANDYEWDNQGGPHWNNHDNFTAGWCSLKKIKASMESEDPYCYDCGFKPCLCRFPHPIKETLDEALKGIPGGWWERINTNKINGHIWYEASAHPYHQEKPYFHTIAETMMLAAFRRRCMITEYLLSTPQLKTAP